VFIQRNGVSEYANAIVGSAERQAPGCVPNGINRVPVTEGFYISRAVSAQINDEPHSDKLNRNVNRKSLLKSIGLFPANVIDTLIQFVGEWYLLNISSSQQADFVQHTGKAAF
jgi:hypothetical protein